ncbi:uncharacterized protein LOC129598488 [Paramacrobiotus metropolitanus]|uniref:uncharacterized protein LOC129598488 n=1 Tax=Paramacrobiotus metropolitanus TaxID=2943436 RepID=UPI0024461EC3|nr:uncharacterized protein LOC129598488 [Paramacrobiotus metropolitanus]
MFLFLGVTGFALLRTINGDHVNFSIPSGQPSDRPQYVLIEEPYGGPISNNDLLWKTQSVMITSWDIDLVNQYGEKVFFNPQPLCPQDGYPDCRNCRPGDRDDTRVMTQCCFAHHWAWQNNRTLRDVLPYRFHLDPVNETGWEPYRDIDGPYGIWHSDPCTGEPAESITNEPYTPWRQRKPK